MFKLIPGKSLLLLTGTAAVLWPLVSLSDGPAANLQVTFNGLKSGQGRVVVAVYDSEASYSKEGAPARTGKLSIKDAAAVWQLNGLAPGRYAIKSFHDLNGDARLNYNLFGVPLEPVAFSNNALVHLRAPNWAETVFEVTAGENAVVIHLD